ncbi:urease accessory UreF family protein [Pseudonocardia sp. ICBG1142]|uniref:urease accessory UreF family protein n=1 Tax=Pseudonocardia sp. ICBG1142 TaxID=2846760 RepID=UPI001CF6BEDC|nr:urease accessory UreF family protein [Pseudonocardia sp. ICBG1142]
MTTTNYSWAATRAAERREGRALDARLAREAADAAAQRRITEQNARRDRAQADRESAERRRTERRQARATARAAARNRALTWASAHVVELLIYPIALLSFALAAPAMAAYGTTIYGPGGVLLAGIPELGMWAFALAVVASRHRAPDRPVVGLQAGVVLFSLVAAGMNLLHGLEQGWTAAVVMAVVSIAGVAAHQLTLAGTPRSRAERRAARLAALVEAKTDRARRLAARDADAVIDTDGTASLVYRPGTYQVRRRALAATTAPGRPIAPTVPVAPVGGDRTHDWDWALAALVEGAGCVGSRLTNDLDYEADPALDCLDSGVDSHLDDDHGSGIAVLDHRPEESGGESRADLRQSTHSRSSSTRGVDPDHDLETASTGRTLDDLRQLLRDAVTDGRVDPGSAESIRRGLRCSAARARQLRNEQQDGGGLR